MPLTTLDPATALIVVDLQRGLVRAEVERMAEVVERARTLADAFRERDLPVVLVNVAGAPTGRTESASHRGSVVTPEWLEIVPELGPRPDDITVTKRGWGAFATTDLEARLRARGVTHVVIAGVSTGIGVESTARQAHELGYNVTLVTDAMTDPRPEAHEHALRNVFPRLGETGTTREILGLLPPA